MVDNTTKPTFSEVGQFTIPTTQAINPLPENQGITPAKSQPSPTAIKSPETPPAPATQAVAKTKIATPREYKWRGNKQQRQAMDNWLNPASMTFGNAYRSFKNAGFSETYSRNVISLAPKWLSEYIDRADFSDEHIKQAVQQLATGAPNSKSPDDTRLKAYELLAKITGLLDGNRTQVTIVTPILGGASTRPTDSVQRTVIDQ